MVTLVQKMDSNNTGLRLCQETSIGVLPVAASQVWYGLEPNSYSEFGAATKTVARQPINPSRQIQKGALVDINPSFAITNDLTQSGLTRLLQGFFVANMRESFDTLPYNGSANPVTAVSGTHTITLTSNITAGALVAGSLTYNSGFTNAANNGLQVVTSIATDVITYSAGLTLEASPPAAARVEVVGYQGASADLTITNSGSAYPVLGSTTVVFTTLPLIPGQWVYIGGDTSSLAFGTAANNGWARIRSIAAHAITFDKTSNEMVTDTGTGKTVQIFWGKVLQNEATSALQVRRTYTAERTLGNPDTSNPTEVQAEYIGGCVPNELTINLTTAEKITCDLAYMGINYSTIPQTGQILSTASGATAPAIVAQSAFNTASNVARAAMTVLSTTDDGAPSTAAFADITELKFSVKNNCKADKAIGFLGSFDISFGFFEGSGSVQAYFNQVTDIQDVINDADVSIDFALVANQAGIVFDLPLLTLSTKGLEVKINEPIMLPINMTAGADKVFNTTMLLEFFDYLPLAA